MSRFVRFQGVERDSRLGINIGVFGLVNLLDRSGRLTEAHGLVADEIYQVQEGV